MDERGGHGEGWRSEGEMGRDGGVGRHGRVRGTWGGMEE